MTKSQTAKPLSLPPSRPVEMEIGAYRPCFEIGSGGMASVYIAREMGASGLQRTVALKVMHEHLARQEAFKNRFLDEARVLTCIEHPYVCRVVGYGEDAGRPFMAMEYLVGEPLSRILRAMKRRSERIAGERRARLFARAVADLAEGLHAAHETRDPQGNLMGVVHRDVTPQNLFLLYDGTVRVLDFGIARYRDRHFQTATTSRLLGKLPYLAPEQIQGELYDRRVDIWALGVILWELATLGRLFKRENDVRTMRAICSDHIPLASEHAPDIPPGLDAILARALERNPEKRYATARQLSDALEIWLARTGDPVTHGDLSDFLNSFFPGSQHERRRWAEEATPHSGVQAGPFRGQRQSYPSRDQEDERTTALPSSRRLGAPGPSPWSNPIPSIAVPSAPAPSTLETTSTEERRPRANSTSPPIAHTNPHTSEEDRSSASGLSLLSLAPQPEPSQEVVPRSPGRHMIRRLHHNGPQLTMMLLILVGLFVATSAATRGTVAIARIGLPDMTSLGLALPVDPPLVDSSLDVVPSEPVTPAPTAKADEEGSSKNVTSSPTPPPANDSRRLAKPSNRAEPARHPTSSHPAPRAPAAPAPSAAPQDPHDSALRHEQSTGDILIVSPTPGIRVFLGSRLLGTTPVKARLPAGTVALQLQVDDRPPTHLTTRIAPGRLNLLTVRAPRSNHATDPTPSNEKTH